MDRRVLLFVGFQDPKAGNAERESPRGTFRRSVPSGSCDVEAAFSRLYPGLALLGLNLYWFQAGQSMYF
jgi:hypothetical protein